MIIESGVIIFLGMLLLGIKLKAKTSLTRQISAIRTECARLGIQAKADDKRAALVAIVGRQLDGPPPLFGLTRVEAEGVIDTLAAFEDRDALVEFVAGVDALPEDEVDQ